MDAPDGGSGARAVSGLRERLGSRATQADQNVLHRAQVEFAVGAMTGDNVAGSKTTNIFYQPDSSRGASVRTVRLMPEDLAEPFVRGPVFGNLMAVAEAQRIVVLRGRRGFGKAAALQHCFAELADDGAPILRLAPETDLSQLDLGDIPEDALLLMPDLNDQAAANLRDFAVKGLTEKLEERGCRLGITVDSEAKVVASARLVVVELDSRPSPRAVFERHLATLMTSAAAARATLLADPDVGRLLDEKLVDTATLEQAARVATILAEHRDDPAVAAVAARAAIDRIDDLECEQWFSNLRDLRAHCMAIALAVLNGLARELVSGAADDLEEMIDPKPERGKAERPAANPFAASPGTSLSALKAKVEPGVSSSPAGDVPITAMSYEDPQYPRWVLRHVWKEHDRARGVLVDWLEKLGRHPARGVRIRTATAVGMLAVESFEFVCPQIICSWAVADDVWVRDSAALALGPPAAALQVGERMTEMIDRWSADNGAPGLQATAARVLGSSTGLRRPAQAMRKLGLLAEVDNLDVALAVADSLGELVTEGTGALAGRVLAEIGEWTTGDRHVRRTGRLAFLWLAWLRGAPDLVAVRTGDKERAMPTLLVIARHNPALVNPVAALWSACLNSGDVSSLARDFLDDWAAAVEPDRAARDQFVDLLRRSAADPRTNRILATRARHWSTGAAPLTSHALLTPLSGVTTRA